MTARRLYLLVIVGLFCSTGASCPRSRQLTNDYAPVVIQPEASLEDVIRVVNANSARIHQVQSRGATLKVNGLVTLDADYAFERPRRFRLRAKTGLTGPELDIGSNPELYWMWVKQNRVVYWGRHAQFYQTAARDVLPVPPDWLIEALGVVELDPTGRHEGPRRNRPGQLEVRSTVPTPGGDINKITVIDDSRGWILEQHLYNSLDQPLASAVASAFEYDPVSGGSLPRIVQIHLHPAQLNLTVQADGHLINQLSSQSGTNSSQLWAMPQFEGFPVVNLSQPGGVARNGRYGVPESRFAGRSPTVLYQADRRLIRRLPPYSEQVMERLR